MSFQHPPNRNKFQKIRKRNLAEVFDPYDDLDSEFLIFANHNEFLTPRISNLGSVRSLHGSWILLVFHESDIPISKGFCAFVKQKYNFFQAELAKYHAVLHLFHRMQYSKRSSYSLHDA